jgi:uncharacterized protein (TIGR02611 family)
VSSEAGKSDAPGPQGAQKPRRAERMAESLHERRERHLRRSRPYRWTMVLVGFVVTAVGVVMTGPIPGPGFLVIPIGLAILALEFDWAERLMHRALDYAERTGDRASEMSTRAKVLTAVTLVAVAAAAVVLAVTVDIPLLPF